MDIFEQMGETFSKAGKEIDKKARELSGTAKLHGNIAKEELKLRDFYRDLGKLYYDAFKDVPHEEMKDLVAKIKKAQGKIDAAKEELREKKARHTCPSCGVTVPKGSAFCNKCGYKMPENEGSEYRDVTEEDIVDAPEYTEKKVNLDKEAGEKE